MNFKEDQSKSLRQEESIQKWRNNKGIGTLLLCQRFGKTKIGVDIIKRIIESKPETKILIIPPSEYITNYWKSYFEKDYIQEYHIHIYSIDYLIKNYEDFDILFELVIVDEVHKMLSDARYEILLRLRKASKWWLNLLGKMPHEKKEGLIINLAPIIDTITTEEAIRKGWVSPYIEYNLKLELTEDDKTKYLKCSSKIKETLDLFNGVHNKIRYNNQKLFETDFDLIYACYSGRKVPHGFVEGKTFREMVADTMGWKPNLDLSTEYGQQRNKYWNPNAIYERCKTFSIIVKVRNEILINNDVKLNAIIEALEKNPICTIIFNESIEFVTKIADKLGKDAIAYHSKIESRPIWDNKNDDWFRYKSGKKQGEPKVFGAKFIKEETIQGIISGKYKYLVTAKALDEGLTIPNLEQVIITAGSTNPIQQSQRVARGCTIDDTNPDKQTRIINLYFEDIILADGTIVKSRDKTKLFERQDKNAIEISTLDEIS